LKHEQIYLFEYRTERELDAAVAEFAYAWYNRVRPHTFNGGLTGCCQSGLILCAGVTILLDHVSFRVSWSGRRGTKSLTVFVLVSLTNYMVGVVRKGLMA